MKSYKQELIEQEEKLANKIIADVDDPEISDEDFNSELLELCKLNLLTEPSQE